MGDQNRYHRQMLLPGVGQQGQTLLRQASVFIVGCGALGTVIAEMLCRAGVGRLVMVDRDFVEWTNLQRQVLFDEEDAKQALPKAIAAERKLKQINHECEIEAYVDDVNHTNIETYAGVNRHVDRQVNRQAGPRKRVQVVVDGVDNFETRYLINDLAVRYGIPYVYGGAVGTVGSVMPVLPFAPQDQAAYPWQEVGCATPCLRDVYEQAPLPGVGPTCDTSGVLGPVVSMVANWQTIETIKILLQAWTKVNRKMVHLDMWDNQIRQFDMTNAYDPEIGHISDEKGFEYLSGKMAAGTTTLCGRNAVQIRPTQPMDLDLKSLAQKLQGPLAGKEQVSAGQHLNTQQDTEKRNVICHDYVLKATFLDHCNADGEPYELTVFPNGRVMVHGTHKPVEAKAIYARYIGS